MKQELHSQGADTERLQQIGSQLRDIDRELQFIKEHATLLIEYEKDKRDLIDHIPEWKREQEEQKRQLGQERTTCAGRLRACRNRLTPSTRNCSRPSRK